MGPSNSTEARRLDRRPRENRDSVGARTLRKRHPRRRRSEWRQTVVIVLVRAENQLLMLLPKTVTTPINNTAMRATSNPYSVTAIPSSERTKRRTAEVNRFIGVVLDPLVVNVSRCEGALLRPDQDAARVFSTVRQS